MEHAKGEEEGTRVGPGEGADAGGEVEWAAEAQEEYGEVSGELKTMTFG